MHTVVKMSDLDFSELRTLIYERSGIAFQDSKRYVLESRLAHRLEELNMDSFHEYLQFLSIGPHQTGEFEEMLNRININETSFFRNEPQLDTFEQIVLPELLEARASTKRLRIWSAACSTGEEPYTLAMQIHRALGVALADWHIEILGTDISGNVLNTAHEAKYASLSLRSVDPLVVSRYFREEGSFSEVDPTIHEMVSFEKHNLCDSLAATRYGTWDAIFCRNAMTFFDEDTRKCVLEMFHNQIADDGVLFVGHNETLRSHRDMFEPIATPQSFAYTKV